MRDVAPDRQRRRRRARPRTRTPSSPSPPSPGRRTGTRRVARGGRFVAIPGFPGEQIDRRLLKDIAYLKSKYKIAITDGYAHDRPRRTAASTRAASPLDIVPGAGGSWADIDRLARWAEPRQDRPRAPFRWVGYNGDSGHGRGHHLHLSWKHSAPSAARRRKWVEVLSFKADRADGPRRATSPRSPPARTAAWAARRRCAPA